MSKVFNENYKAVSYYIYKEYENDEPDEDFIIELMDKFTDDESTSRYVHFNIWRSAIKYNHINVATKLYEKFDCITMNYELLLHKAVEQDKYEIVKLLLSHPKINVNSLWGNKTVLMVAKNVEMAKILLDHPQINVNQQTFKQKSTALMLQKDISIIKLLLEHPKINVNMQNKRGNTALMVHHNVEIIELLLDRDDIDVNIQNKRGNSALTIHYNNKNILKLLLNRDDIDVNKTNEYGNTLFMILSKYGEHYSDILELLQKIK